MSSRTNTILTIAGLSVAGLVAYAVYFDYRRRTDSDFRKQLRKQKKRVDKSLAESKEALVAATEVSEGELREALKEIESEPKPATQEAREHYFMSQVGMGEQLAARGEAFHLPAALSFYRALAVYPSPPELLSIYQKTVPEPIVKLVLRLINLDVSASSAPDLGVDDVGDASPTRGPPSETSSQEWDKITTKIGAYYEVFPPKSANVSIQARPEGSDTSGPEKVLVLTKDIAAGEVIFKEHPMLACLDYDLQRARTHCSHCFKEIEPSSESTSLVSSDGVKSAFCSKACQNAAKTQWHSLLLTLDPPLPSVPELSALAPTPAALEVRRAAQVQLVAYMEKDRRAYTMLVARFIARQLTASTKALSTAGEDGSVGDYAGAETGEYRIEDHVERWTTGSINPPSDEYPLLGALLQATLPGLEAFLAPDSYTSLLGKIAFNSFGVCFGSGRDDRPPPTLRPEDAEFTRTPHGTARQVGTALYSMSAYLPHSCAPNAHPAFSLDTTELHLIADKDLKKGDELSIAYVDVVQQVDESAKDCRLRRRKELARGWKFPCQCSRCVEEASEQ